MDADIQVRLHAFQFLEQQQKLYKEAIPRLVLEQGFDFEGRKVPLISPQGIFKPAILELPLSFHTVPVVEGEPRPYDDELGADGLIQYRYRGTDPNHRDNVGLRRCMEQKVPLIYLYGVIPGLYVPVWPVFIVGDPAWIEGMPSAEITRASLIERFAPAREFLKERYAQFRA